MPYIPIHPTRHPDIDGVKIEDCTHVLHSPIPRYANHYTSTGVINEGLYTLLLALARRGSRPKYIEKAVSPKQDWIPLRVLTDTKTP